MNKHVLIEILVDKIKNHDKRLNVFALYSTAFYFVQFTVLNVILHILCVISIFRIFR